jgi:hypothetical protein
MAPKKQDQQLGGATRAARLTGSERSAIARQAALVRWGNTLPRAIASGSLEIGDVPLSCAVLDNKVRVLTQGTFLQAMGRSRSPMAGSGITTDDVPVFLQAENLYPYIDDEVLKYSTPIRYRTQKTGVVAYGYNALLLPKVCIVYTDALEDGALFPNQIHIAEEAQMLIRGLAMVGIISLVDDATGFTEQRARDELTQILEHYIAPELLPWTKKFPDEFFRQIFRLHGWPYVPGSVKRSPYVGQLINKLIYEQLPPGVLEKMRELNPIVPERGYRRYTHHQFLTVDTGNAHLDKQIAIVTTLMRISRTKAEFNRHFEEAFKNMDDRLPLIIDVPARIA